MAPLQEKRLFLLDMDGTIYLGDQLFPTTLPFLKQVRAMGGRYLFLTNNSSRSASDYVDKLAALGVPAREEDVLTSTDALIARLSRRPAYRLCYAFGTDSFVRQLERAGIPVIQTLDDGIDCLLVGFDTQLTFQKLEDACILLHRGVDFWATNPDWVCPTGYGSVPDCGSLCEMLARATGRTPQVVGKPQPDLIRLAMARTGFSPAQTLMVGDRLYTDIACGANAEVDTALVLSGETARSDLHPGQPHPTWTFDDLAHLGRALAAPAVSHARLRAGSRGSGQGVRAAKYLFLFLLSITLIPLCAVGVLALLAPLFQLETAHVWRTGIRIGLIAWFALFLLFAIRQIIRKQRT